MQNCLRHKNTTACLHAIASVFTVVVTMVTMVTMVVAVVVAVVTKGRSVILYSVQSK